MRRIGYLMITVSFLAGSLAATIDKEKMQWGWFTAALAVGIVGVGLVRFGAHREKRGEGKLTEDIQSIEASLSRIVQNMTGLNAQKSSINTYDVHRRIDELFPEDLDTFVRARESIAHGHGLNAYADVMSSFAAGERYLNRVWSASTDGYIDEVHAYLDKAQAQFAESLDKVRRLKANT
jgi:uncharacterized membrane protein YeaQ/YmgE (transglycosylase-associated protein family)